MSKSLGSTGEMISSHFLTQCGYTVLARRFHSRYGEIDLVARDGDTIVFCEVKARRRNYEDALLSVTQAKQRKIARTALTWLNNHPEHQDSLIRFDVLLVIEDRHHILLYHIADAFSSPG